MSLTKGKLIILTTGGTIEKIYDEHDGLLENKEAIFKSKILNKIRHPHTEIEVHCLMSKDSLEMNLEDRKIIFEAIKKYQVQHTPIVVIHGTDTMDQTLDFCLSQGMNTKVPVIFTGAMKPFGFDDSDALQNVSEAIFIAQNIKPGFYLSFHGKIFQAGSFIKNKSKKTFEEKI